MLLKSKCVWEAIVFSKKGRQFKKWKDYRLSITFWLYQHGLKYAPLQCYSHFFLTFFKRNTLYSTFLLINDQNTKWGAATLVTNATIWSFHSMYHYIVIYYRWLHSILRLSPSVRFCVHLMAAIMAKHKSCQIDIGRSNGKTQGGGIMLKMSKILFWKVPCITLFFEKKNF